MNQTPIMDSEETIVIPSKGLLFSSFLQKLFLSSYNFLKNVTILISLHTLDLLTYILNILTPSLNINQNVCKPFSPDKPPKFNQNPFIFLICYLVKVFKKFDFSIPLWLECWSNWDGIGSDGKWLDVDLNQVKQGDRGPCPGLNALANHGIINPTGRDLSFHEIASAISRTYNVSPFFALRATYGASELFKGRKGINLSDMSAHGLIEHDASLLRLDIDSSTHKTFKEIQAHPHQQFIERFFPSSKRLVTPNDFSKALTIRRIECENQNPTFYRSLKFDLIGSENCAILLAITGGKRDAIRNLVGIKGFECFDNDWRPAGLESFGLNMIKAEFLMAWIELGTGSSNHPETRHI